MYYSLNICLFTTVMTGHNNESIYRKKKPLLPPLLSIFGSGTDPIFLLIVLFFLLVVIGATLFKKALGPSFLIGLG